MYSDRVEHFCGVFSHRLSQKTARNGSNSKNWRISATPLHILTPQTKVVCACFFYSENFTFSFFVLKFILFLSYHRHKSIRDRLRKQLNVLPSTIATIRMNVSSPEKC